MAITLTGGCFLLAELEARGRSRQGWLRDAEPPTQARSHLTFKRRRSSSVQGPGADPAGQAQLPPVAGGFALGGFGPGGMHGFTQHGEHAENQFPPPGGLPASNVGEQPVRPPVASLVGRKAPARQHRWRRARRRGSTLMCEGQI